MGSTIFGGTAADTVSTVAPQQIEMDGGIDGRVSGCE
jgi:hypothetical protein